MWNNSHIMPFGTRITRTGAVCFQIWAPGAEQVDLYAGVENCRVFPMERLKGGWFQCTVSSAGPGLPYRFRIDRDLLVPDPAARAQSVDVHGPSVVLAPEEFVWHDQDWTGRPWEETVIYELHVGAFTPLGTFAAVAERLDHLVDLGVTAMELLPVAEFPGRRDWGYDGALLFAPATSYGEPEDLKRLVDKAHQKGLMVFLDVVYNHFGPEGNYLYVYAREAFFREKIHTPWGGAINFSGPGSKPVRDFFIHNALYWLEEYHLDGLRLDAVHGIYDDSRPDIVEEIAQAVAAGPGRERHIHLMLENDKNQVRYLRGGEAQHSGGSYDAQWNDDLHHALHVLLTGERTGYYADYAAGPLEHLGRCLTEGFAYQGEASVYREGAARGEPSAHLPATAFISFLQNHDQVGNRPLGERISTLCDARPARLAVALLLLAPSIPLLFMGEEFAATTPFFFFCNFGPELADKVAEGRREGFRHFAGSVDPGLLERLVDPGSQEAFERSRLDWDELRGPAGKEAFAFYRELLRLRGQEIVPRLRGLRGGGASYGLIGPHALRARWTLGDGSVLRVVVNFGKERVRDDSPPVGRLLYAYPRPESVAGRGRYLEPLAIGWFLESPPGDYS